MLQTGDLIRSEYTTDLTFVIYNNVLRIMKRHHTNMISKKQVDDNIRELVRDFPLADVFFMRTIARRQIRELQEQGHLIRL